MSTAWNWAQKVVICEDAPLHWFMGIGPFTGVLDTLEKALTYDLEMLATTAPGVPGSTYFWALFLIILAPLQVILGDLHLIPSTPIFRVMIFGHHIEVL